MLKRIVILVFILSALSALAMAPMSSTNAPKLQSTEAPTDAPTVDVGVTVVVGTSVPEGTPGTVPVTGGGGMPMSTMLIFGLVAVLGVAVVIGGMALLSRRQ
jgi:hypothetical protein